MRSLAKLGQALVPVIPADDPPAAGHTPELLKYCCPDGLYFERRCKKEQSCNCLGCILEHLLRVPLEIFVEIILAGPRSVQSILSVGSQIPRLLSELERSPAPEFNLSCHGDVFQTSFTYGGRSYITSLSNQEIDGSRRIKSGDMMYNHVLVWLDRIGITQVEFVHSEVLNATSRVGNDFKESHNANESIDARSKRQWVCAIAPTRASLCVKSKVCKHKKSDFC